MFLYDEKDPEFSIDNLEGGLLRSLFVLQVSSHHHHTDTCCRRPLNGSTISSFGFLFCSCFPFCFWDLFLLYIVFVSILVTL